MGYLLLICALTLFLAAAGCGAPATAPSPSAPTSTDAPAPEELVITFRDGSGTSQQWRLTCEPPGGDHPDPERACQVLEKNGAAALPAVPKDRMCAQVYGGPETATITGTWAGRPVLSRLSRVNGCEVGRWNALTGLLPPGSA